MSWDDFFPGWEDRDGDGRISFDEDMEEYYAYHAIMDEDSCDGYNSSFDDDDDDDDFDDGDDDFGDGDDEYYFNGGGNFGRRYTFEGSGSQYESTDYTTSYNSPKKNNIPPSAALDLKEAFIPPKKHIPSLWDDQWELASLLLRIAYLAALVLLCYHQFGEAGGFPEFIEIMVYILVISIFGAIGFFAFFVWRSVCKEKDPYPDYFDNLAEKPETLYPRPASIKLWLLFFIVSFIALRIGAHPENIQKAFMLTDSAAVAFSVAGLLTPALLVLIYKAFTTMKLIGVKKKLMKDLEKKKVPAIINPLKVLLTVIFAAVLILSIRTVAMNKAKADQKAEALYKEVISCFEAEKYDEAHEKLDALEKLNRATYKETKAFHLFCEAKEAYDRGDAFGASDLLMKIQRINHTKLSSIVGWISYDYFRDQERLKQAKAEVEEAREKAAAAKVPQPVEEKPKKVVVHYHISGSSGKSKKSSDPYHASDFSYVEDFYDEYYDDFFDIDDAEDYYMDHYDD